MLTTELRTFLLELEKTLDGAARMGGGADEPEGSRYIQLSDTLAKKLADDACRLARLIR